MGMRPPWPRHLSWSLLSIILYFCPPTGGFFFHRAFHSHPIRHREALIMGGWDVNDDSSRPSYKASHRSPSPSPPSPYAPRVSTHQVAINDELMVMEDPKAMLDFLDQQMHELNPVNLATAINRLSKVAKPEDREWIRNDSRFDELLDVAYGVLRDMEPRGLASTINGLAKLDYNPGTQFLQALARAADDDLSMFGPQELSTLLQGLAKLRANADLPKDFLGSVVDAARPLLTNSNPQDLANLVYSLARLGHRPPKAFLDQVASESEFQLNVFKLQELTNLLYGFAQLSYLPDRRFLEAFHAVAARRVPFMNEQDLVATIDGLAKLQVRPPPAFTYSMAIEALKQIATKGWLVPSIATSLSGLVRMDYKPETKDLDNWLRPLRDQLSTIEVSQIVMLLQALSKVEHQPGKALLREALDCIMAGLDSLPPTSMASLIHSFASLGWHPGTKVMDMWLKQLMASSPITSMPPLGWAQLFYGLAMVRWPTIVGVDDGGDNGPSTIDPDTLWESLAPSTTSTITTITQDGNKPRALRIATLIAWSLAALGVPQPLKPLFDGCFSYLATALEARKSPLSPEIFQYLVQAVGYARLVARDRLDNDDTKKVQDLVKSLGRGEDVDSPDDTTRHQSTAPPKLTKDVLSVLQRMAPYRVSLRPVMGDDNRDMLILPTEEGLPPVLVQATGPDDYIRPLGSTREDQSVLNGQAWLKRQLVMGRASQDESPKLAGVVNVPHFDWSRAGPPTKKKKKDEVDEGFIRPTVSPAKLVLLRDCFAREGLNVDDYFDGAREQRRQDEEYEGDRGH